MKTIYVIGVERIYNDELYRHTEYGDVIQMMRIEKRREQFLRDKNANLKITLGIGFDDGYKKGLEDAAIEFVNGGWQATAWRVRDLWKREEEK